jgi:hypothetical protein
LLGPLLGRIPAPSVILAGIVLMGVAGLRYWVSDPFRVLLTPPWEAWIRHLFIAPGYRIQSAGCILALAGPALKVLRWAAGLPR